MLAEVGLPPELWAEALTAFTHVKNLAPRAALGPGVTPRSLSDGIGCRAWATRPADAVPGRRKPPHHSSLTDPRLVSLQHLGQWRVMRA